jgi:alginate O-acetyltransferase complex protein AlgI
MLFNTYEFFFFFACVLVFLIALPSRHRWVLLLGASYVFYAGWRPSFLVWLLFSTVLDYTSARVIDQAKSDITRRIALAAAITINLGILFTFKYLDFFLTNVVGLAGLFGVALPHYVVKLVLPLGISFYTFQSLSYVIDVYTRRIGAERHFGLYALYVAFFPQLVAGPIGRAPLLLHQFRAQKTPTPDEVTGGLWLVGYGLFKKMCIADLVAPVVNGIYAQPEQFNGSYLALATLLFAVQIYCDFSGYSDIAIGLARIMGFHLLTNFRQPYFSTSLAEFWRRWHISLSTWFRDYLYVPLGGNHVAYARWVLNILVVFLISGIWHGAAWTFIVWGLIHGIGLIVERAAKEALARRKGWMAWWNAHPVASAVTGLVVTNAVVVLGWVFFRAGSLDAALAVLRGLLHPGPLGYGTFKVLGLPSFELALAAINIVALFVVDYHLYRDSSWLARARLNAPLQICAGVALVYFIVCFGVFDRIEFIYFQF